MAGSSKRGLTRRQALTGVPAAALAAGASAGPGRAAEPAASAGGLVLPETDPDPLAAARDADYWRAVAGLYDVTEEVIQLENAYWGMMARPVLAAHQRALEMVNRRSSYYARREWGADYGRVKARVAGALGVSPEEIALTRGATEALQNLIGGYNRLRPGDAVLHADHDYDSMITAMTWLPARRGVEVVTISLPEPYSHQGVIDAYEAALDANPRVRMILLTHLGHRSGLVIPVKEICEMARARGVDAIVDAAHSWGQMDFTLPELGADFVGLNLHKWIGAPIGAGVLYARKDRIADIDPYMGEEDSDPPSIDARVHTGTANFATYLAVPDALDLHFAIGPARKEARLRHLRDLWAETVRDLPGVDVLTPNDPRMHAGITCFRLNGMTGAQENIALAEQLLREFNIFTVHRTGLAAGACIRATPMLFTTEDDVMALAGALTELGRG